MKISIEIQGGKDIIPTECTFSVHIEDMPLKSKEALKELPTMVMQAFFNYVALNSGSTEFTEKLRNSFKHTQSDT